nr:hypothetical protein CFP56_28759 [Quercus suber]
MRDYLGRVTTSSITSFASLESRPRLCDSCRTAATMNEYETRRLEKIKANQALLAELDIKPIRPTHPTRRSDGVPAAKRRKLAQPESAPSRTSARIAAAPVRPTYNDEPDIKAVSLPRSVRSSTKHNQQVLGSVVDVQPEALVPLKDVDSIRAGWTSWKSTADPPTRDAEKTFHFADYPDFTPNKSPEEMLREGCFGGSYYRPLKSRKLGIIVEDDWKELPEEWIRGLDVEMFLTSPDYNAEVNKYKVAGGQTIEQWEAAGWISHEHDVRGWFQWYTRFFQGRRCDDDAREVSRWKKCVGETGRFRRTLLKKYVQMGVREVWDDGEDEDSKDISPVVHQTCHHWGFEITQWNLDRFWKEGR